MSDLRRYSPKCGQVVKTTDGDFVKFEDVAKQVADMESNIGFMGEMIGTKSEINDILTKERDELRKFIGEIEDYAHEAGHDKLLAGCRDALKQGGSDE